MTKQFGSIVDLQKIPILGLVPESNSTAPSSPVNGQLWFDTSQSPARLMVRENGAWARVSDPGSLPPSGSAGGSLSGTYPNPTIAAGAITTTEIFDGTIAGVDISSAIKDAAAGVASLRTLGLGAAQAMPGNTTLNQITAPTADVSLASFKITSLATPTALQDAANKIYVDNVAAGIDHKESVKAASVGNLTLSGLQTVDGVALVGNDRCLVKNQTTQSQNGIYSVSSGAWARTLDSDTWTELISAFTFVEQGTQADSSWVCTVDAGGTLGTTNVTWVQFGGGGSTYTAGAGLSGTTTFDVGGTANRISVSADNVDIAATYVGQTSITTLGTITSGTWNGTDIAVADGGTGSSTAAGARTNLGATGKYPATLGALTAGVEATITHSLNTTEVIAAFRLASNNRDIILDWRVIDANSIGVTADVAYSASAVKTVVIG